MSVDLDTGDREVISSSNTGSGPDFESPNKLVLDVVNGRAFASNYGNGSIIQVDLTSGDRTSSAASMHGVDLEQSRRPGAGQQ